MRILRLKKTKEITGTLKTGKRVHGASITIVYAPAKETKFAVCVGKKFGKSVQRNRIKRLLREAFRPYARRIAPCRILLIPKIREEYGVAFFAGDLKKIFAREGLLETASE